MGSSNRLIQWLSTVSTKGIVLACGFKSSAYLNSALSTLKHFMGGGVTGMVGIENGILDMDTSFAWGTSEHQKEQ